MDSEEVIVLVVGDDEKNRSEQLKNQDLRNAIGEIKILANYLDDVKKEELTPEESEDLISEYLDEEFLLLNDDDLKKENTDVDWAPSKKLKYNCEKKVKYKEGFSKENIHRHSVKSEPKSFIAKLKRQYNNFEDEWLIINDLEQEMRAEKPPPLPKDFYIINGDCKYRCLFCDSVSEKLPVATRHYYEKHGPRYLKCYACGNDFRSKTNLYKHEKRCDAPDVHLLLKARARSIGRKARHRPYLNLVDQQKQLPRRFQCTMCSASFAAKAGLDAHENLHRGVRPYCCHICPNAYTSYRCLQRHLLHHSDAQYICDHCGRSFKIKAGLLSHMETHKPERRFGCPQCERRYTQRSDLEVHVLRVHKNLPYPCACPMCPKRYARMSILNQHTQKVHAVNIITRKMFTKSLPRQPPFSSSYAMPSNQLECDPSSLLNRNNKDDNLFDLDTQIKIENCDDDV